MKLQSRRQINSPQTSSGSVNHLWLVATIAQCAISLLVWCLSGSVGRMVIGSVMVLLFGPINLLLARFLLRAGASFNRELTASFIVTAAFCSMLAFFSFAMSGTLASWTGFDGLSFLLVVFMAVVSTVAWVVAKLLLFKSG